MHSLDRKTILLVEDEAITAMLEKQQLEKFGYSVHHVTTGKKAVQTILDNVLPVDLILMDIDLGSGIDGTQAAEQIRSQKDIPVVFLSSHTEPEVVEKTEKITSYGYVVKNSGIVVLDTSIKMAFKLFNEKIKLLKKDNELKEILEATTDGIWKWNFKDNTLFFSDKYYKMLGYDPDDFTASYESWAKLIHPDDLGKALKTAEKYLETKPDRYENQFRLKTKDGSFKWIKSNARIAKRDINNEPVYMIGNHEDITERKMAEDEIKKQLSEKELLLREVHHRVKNNIANVESFLALQNNSTDNPEAKEAINTAVSRIQTMRVLYDKLLVSKDLREISMKNYIEDLIDSLQNVFVEKGNIVIEKHISDFSIKSKEAITIGIIINELLTNVFKYAFKDRDRGTVSVSVEKTENLATIIIQDNGIGIDERILENKSPGFGLTIVKMLVEQLQGTYSIVNKNGTRSVIEFKI